MYKVNKYFKKYVRSNKVPISKDTQSVLKLQFAFYETIVKSLREPNKRRQALSIEVVRAKTTMLLKFM